jgi:hypothetical protein
MYLATCEPEFAQGLAVVGILGLALFISMVLGHSNSRSDGRSQVATDPQDSRCSDNELLESSSHGLVPQNDPEEEM